MHMPEGYPHASTLPGFRGTRDPERFVTRSRSGRKKKRMEFEDVQPQSIPNPTQENFLPSIGSTSIVGLVTLLSMKMLNTHPIRVSEHGIGEIRRKQIIRQPICLFWADTTLTTALLTRLPGNLGDRCWRSVTGEVRIPLDPPLSISPHISPAALQEMRQVEFLDYSQKMGNIDLFGPTALRAEPARDAQRLQESKDELDIAHMKIDSIDHQLYAHLRRGRDVRVVPLPPTGGARTRQRRSGLRTKGGGTSRRGRGTGDDSE
ncbi:hypothetical protein GIB67_019559 [Kingdonia uniflora]|uniref:Uncharacterized protein n=1 Tax=Kingdonia uniflora TaxID=39325 RepID=A0A7J7N098_9MAGN|nr:hypothetical protein GIB67_019559 [Kingdonia uniflora]